VSEQQLVLRRPPVQRPKAFGREKHAVLTAIADARAKIHGAPIDERLKSIIASAVGHLLKGGYSFDLIRGVAVNLAVTDPRKLAQLGAHVRVEQARREQSEHVARMRAEREELERGLPQLDTEGVIREMESNGLDTSFFKAALEKRKRRKERAMPKCNGCGIVGPETKPLGRGEYCASCTAEITRERELNRPEAVEG
jgi:uncharacterized protein (UPF0335 family)